MPHLDRTRPLVADGDREAHRVTCAIYHIVSFKLEYDARCALQIGLLLCTPKMLGPGGVEFMLLDEDLGELGHIDRRPEALRCHKQRLAT